MSDGHWLQRQGFSVCDQTEVGFVLWVRRLKPDAPLPRFAVNVKVGTSPHQNGLTAYYSERCPFAEYHVRHELTQSAQRRALPLTIVKLATPAEAQNAPTAATVFSLFRDGQFVTTDLSVCLDSRFERIMGHK